LKEKQDILRKVIASAIVVIGVIMVAGYLRF
jgi:hypothetical protein